jgi:hypothetical protein
LLIEFPVDFNHIIIQKKQTELDLKLELFQNENMDKLDVIKDKSDTEIFDNYFKKINSGFKTNKIIVKKACFE